jgi:anti-sigma B factor antagonist
MNAMSEILMSTFADRPQPFSFQQQPPDRRLSLEICPAGDTAVVYCRGRIAWGHEPGALSAQLSGPSRIYRQLVLELSQVEFVDGTGLGELVSVLLSARSLGCVVRLASPNPWIYQLLELTKLTSIFEVFPTAEDALATRPARLA